MALDLATKDATVTKGGLCLFIADCRSVDLVERASLNVALSRGELSKKVSIEAHRFSKEALKKISAAKIAYKQLS